MIETNETTLLRIIYQSAFLTHFQPQGFVRPTNPAEEQRKEELRTQIQSFEDELEYLSEYQNLLEADLAQLQKKEEDDIRGELGELESKVVELAKTIEDTQQTNESEINTARVDADGQQLEINAEIEEDTVDAGQGNEVFEARIGGIGVGITVGGGQDQPQEGNDTGAQ